MIALSIALLASLGAAEEQKLVEITEPHALDKFLHDPMDLKHSLAVGGFFVGKQYTDPSLSRADPVFKAYEGLASDRAWSSGIDDITFAFSYDLGLAEQYGCHGVHLMENDPKAAEEAPGSGVLSHARLAHVTTWMRCAGADLCTGGRGRHARGIRRLHRDHEGTGHHSCYL
jgi:hypothetical protein